jgi:beta-galactosidase/beta-glucuronidase
MVGRILYLLALVVPCEAAWRCQETPLTTPWTAQVSPDRVWPEYPRPQMVRTAWTHLNGLWDYAITPRAAERPDTWEGQILVPFCVESALSGVKKSVGPDQALWYQRRCKVRRSKDHRTLLHFGAVDWHAQVWVNDQLVGEHKGGYTPFSFDITDALKRGQQTLTVRVWDPTDQWTQPRGKQVSTPGGIWYTAVTGIWQTVWLEQVPEIHIARLTVVPDVAASRLEITVTPNRMQPDLRVTVTASKDEQGVGTASGSAGRAVAGGHRPGATLVARQPPPL